MPRALVHVAAGALLALLAARALALGIGQVDNRTALGHPLRFAVELRLDAGESIGSECIAVEAHAGDVRIAPSALRWALEPGAEGSVRTLRIASSVAIDEPVVNLNLHFSCPTRLTRRFVALVDPPAVALAEAGTASAMEVVPPMRSDAPSALALKAAAESQGMVAPGSEAPASAAVKAPRRSKVARESSPAGVDQAPRAVASAPPGPTMRKPQRKVAAASGPAAPARLKLEPADDAATRAKVESRVAAAAPLPAAAASSVAEAASAPEDPAIQRARERLLALEDSLGKLQAEGRATQASLLQLQQRLRESEAQRYANPLVYLLGALCALLAAALAIVLWKRTPVQQAGAPWYAASADTPAKVAADEWGAVPVEAPAPALPRVDEAPAVETTASPMMLSQVQVLASQAAPVAAPAEAADPALAVEELIDLEQQAEFFIVLGQDEAAIDLLMGHLRSSGGASPLPYLKLLEIYRRRGDREASERIRERFNQRFNAYAPAWDADPQQGRSLSDYPSVVASLQGLWKTPTEAMRALEASIFRRDGSSATFDLPAYRELLFLYAVARDLAERGEAQAVGVDLLLPIGADAAADAPLTRLHPSPQAALRVDPPTEVDVDITSLDDGAAIDDARPSRLHTDFSPTSGHLPLGVEPSITRH